MKVNISFKNVAETFKKLQQQANIELKVQSSAVAKRLLDDLKASTPVDTGEARDAWAMQSTAEGFDITNSAEHIGRLNEGSSKQAPAFFIESTALKYGTPQGAITEII